MMFMLKQDKVNNCQQVWSLPIPTPIARIKYNFDRTSKGNPSLVGANGVFRDCQGNIIAVSQILLGNNQAEM